MSSSFLQLVLDFVLFAIIHYCIIFPLITRLLDYIKGEPTTVYDVSEISKALRTLVGQQSEPKPSSAITAPAPFKTESTTSEKVECERCDLPLEDIPRFTRQSCGCTWCAGCVEKCFKNVIFDPDIPLKCLSKSCEFAQKLTIRQMRPYVKHLLSEESYKDMKSAILLRDAMSGIDLSKYDWVLENGEEESEEDKFFPDMSSIKRESW
ncbi:unnamed protein product [Aureobasidium vineae]|uniref:Uncharacterized protein n=1 Tax=Aureobasidium vineae TaxID=2773715 RepID=A0A9N8PFC9_9PEZI|nr:unnamed protein product [Aureobasidium vineae]